MRKLAFGFASLLLAAAALAQNAAADGKWWKRPRIAQELQLSSAQAAELEKIFASSKPKLIDLRADLEKKQFDYDQAMQSDEVDRKSVAAKIEAREEARARLQKELALMELDMKQVLKPDQREKLMRMRDNARLQVQQRRRRLRDQAMEDDGAPPPTPRRNR